MGSDGPDLAGAGCGDWSSDTTQSHCNNMASLVAVEDTGHAGDKVWTQNDPAIFRNERVLRTLLKRELKICPTGPSSSKNYFLTTQTELKPGVRRGAALPRSSVSPSTIWTDSCQLARSQGHSCSWSELSACLSVGR